MAPGKLYDSSRKTRNPTGKEAPTVNRLFLRMAAALAFLCLLLTGCKSIAFPQASEKPQDTTAATPSAPPAEPSLQILRQAMAGTTELFAVAYLGQIDNPTDISAYIRENNPQLLQNYPFIGQIPRERILGTTGEIYCIIPREKNAAVSVSQMVWNANGDFVPGGNLYRAESGSPFILLCNSSSYGLDTQITITTPKQDTVNWCPGIDDSFTVSLPWDPETGELAWDISLYEAGPRDIYHKWYQEGWTLPYEETLEGTQWVSTGTGPDGREAQITLVLNRDGTATVSWQYTGGATQEYFSGTWGAWLEHRAFLQLDLQRTGGVLNSGAASLSDSFAVLLSPEGDKLLLGFSYHGSGLPLDPVEKDVLAIFEAFGR